MAVRNGPFLAGVHTHTCASPEGNPETCVLTAPIPFSRSRASCFAALWLTAPEPAAMAVVPAAVADQCLAMGLRLCVPPDGNVGNDALVAAVAGALLRQQPGLDTSLSALRGDAARSMGRPGGRERYGKHLPKKFRTGTAYGRHTRAVKDAMLPGNLATLLAILDAHSATATVWTIPASGGRMLPCPAGSGFVDPPARGKVSALANHACLRCACLRCRVCIALRGAWGRGGWVACTTVQALRALRAASHVRSAHNLLPYCPTSIFVILTAGWP